MNYLHSLTNSFGYFVSKALKIYGLRIVFITYVKKSGVMQQKGIKVQIQTIG